LLAIALCALIQLSVQIDDPTLPTNVITTMASRDMRYHHFLWHNLRETWLNLDASTQHAISALGWGVQRPAAFYRPLANGAFEQVVLEDNDSGEDFLYMHRQMVIQVNKMVAGTTYGKINGWTGMPAPGDKRWPVPAAYPIPGDTGFTNLIATVKSDDFYWDVVVDMEAELNNEENLRKWTLGQLGAKCEFTVHKWMHLRFSELNELGIRPSPRDNPTPKIELKWDDPKYRWLGDTYSSHVNPVFWRIHGWVDNKIEQWRKANGLTSITWKGTWEGGPFAVYEDLFVAGAVNDSNDDDDDTDDDDDNDDYEPSEEVLSAMSQVVAIMLRQDTNNYFKNTRTTP